MRRPKRQLGPDFHRNGATHVVHLGAVNPFNASLRNERSSIAVVSDVVLGVRRGAIVPDEGAHACSNWIK